MKIERYLNDQDQFRCFVTDNRHVSRSGMVKIIEKLAGVKILKRPKFFDDDIFCEFEYKRYLFKMDEPYGDNATYDVVSPVTGLTEFDEIADHFEKSTSITRGD